MNHHFVEPEYYLVSYWPGTTPDDDVQTIRTDSKYKQKNSENLISKNKILSEIIKLIKRILSN